MAAGVTDTLEWSPLAAKARCDLTALGEGITVASTQLEDVMVIRLARNTAVLTIGGVLAASLAFGEPCGPSMSTLGIGLTGNAAASIRLTGRNAPAPASPAVPTGGVLGTQRVGAPYGVEIKNCFNDPVVGATVTFDFTPCLAAAGGDIEISCDQSLNP